LVFIAGVKWREYDCTVLSVCEVTWLACEMPGISIAIRRTQ